MKNVILSLSLITLIGFTSCKSETKSTSDLVINIVEVAQAETIDLNFGVRGNCGMCKRTIEKAANTVDGVKSADWDRNKKNITVSFDDTKTNAMAIHKAIAASGYDTEKVVGDLTAYEGLPGCCKYDHEMEMNQSGEIKEH